ncbi:MAG TPA: hypothetical protein VKY89_04835 [Thermoanaerobaculia bacterium]|nr:hypothetical protein [Thermoanaerobaculia bacterium]
MSGFALAQAVADAVLYEGYVLYPYRASSAKNRVRFQFGVVAPRGYVETGGADPWEMQTECLLEPAAPGVSPRLGLKVRFLQLQARTIEEAVAGSATGFLPVEHLDLDGERGEPGERLVAWDEGIERELELSGIAVHDLLAGDCRFPLVAGEGLEAEELRGPAGNLRGRLVRRRWAIGAVVRLAAERVGGLLRLRVRVENQTPWPRDAAPDRDLALRRSLLGAHTLLAVQDGAFVSLLDPPAPAAPAAAACANLHTWPVLIGPAGSREVMLSSPIILYDYPAVAPESPGDLCDATEIDEILTLRIMTLTDEEKREARGTDERARRIVARADTMPRELLERLHGAVRSLTPAAAPPPPAPELASWESFLNPPGMAPPEEATLEVGEARLGRGSRVRLTPKRRADSMDLFLAGRVARVAAVHRDVDGQAYLAVSLDDDPAADLHAHVGRYFYFYPDEVEPLALHERRP